MRMLLLRLTVAAVTFASAASAISLRHNHQRASVPGTAVADKITQTKFRCDQKPVLPAGVKKLLDRGFPGWRFHPAPQDDCDTVKSIGGEYAYPEMIIGDFDDDGQSDYAVLVDGDPDLLDRPGGYIIAFLSRNNAYAMRIITREGGSSLLLMPKGSSDFDYGTQREFTYSRDTIFSGEGMGGMSYVYENGKFRAIITSD